MTTKKILFLGTHGQYNIGDELLLETFLSQLGNQHQYSVNSYNPAFTMAQLAGTYNVQVFHTTQNKRQLPARILQNDLLFFGGGNIIKELYQSVGRNRYSTLLMILMMVTFAHIFARKPIIMSNIGVGPLQTRLGHLLAKLILRQVDYISVRDQKSHNTCCDLGLDRRKLHFVPDAVFAHDASFFEIEQEEGLITLPLVANATSPVPISRLHSGQVWERGLGGEGELKIALNLNYNIENPDNWDNFIDNLAQSLCDLAQQRPIEIHALPMQMGFKAHDDLQILTAFRHKITGIDVILHQPKTPQDIGQIIAACDMVVAERLHTLIIAAILHKPFVALMYDVKVRELVKLLGMEEFAVDINHPFNPITLTHKLLALTERQHHLSAHLQARASALSEQVRRYFQAINQQIMMVNGTEKISDLPDASPTPLEM